MALASVDEDSKDGQTTVFLTGLRKYSTTHSKEVPPPSSSCCCKSWSKKKICCVSCLVIVLLFGLVIGGLFLSQMMKPVMGGDAEAWERKLAAKVGPFNGVYDLKSVSDDYEAFLNAIGIPSFAVFFILRGSETLEMEILEDGSVKSKTITDFVTQDHYYEFDKEWEMEYGKGMGVMHVVCTREKPHILMCRSEERDKGWRIDNKLFFYEQGAISVRTFHNKNITAKKYYQRRGVAGSLFKEEASEEYSFFSNEEDDDFFSDEDDDDEFWDD